MTKVSRCMKHSVMPDGNVTAYVTQTDEGVRAGVAGTLTCGSVWVCPVCSDKITARRATELETGIGNWTATGGRLIFVTLTMRHHRGQALGELWSALSYAWNKVTSGRGWELDQSQYGIEVAGKTRIPWVRAVEVTHGENGWHVHVHALLFVRGEIDADALGASMFQRWRDALTRRGLAAPLARSGGLDVREITDTEHAAAADAMSGYFTKMTYDGTGAAALEATRGQQKKGRAGGRSPFQILESIVMHLDDADDPAAQQRAEADVSLWREWERVSKGKRQLTWSKGCRELLRIGDEISDEEIAAEDMRTEESVSVCTMDAETYARVRRDLAGFLSMLEDEWTARPEADWQAVRSAPMPPILRL